MNQADVVSALRFFGCSVAVTSAHGEGFPDLLVGHHGETFLLEIKDKEKGAAAKLTPAQVRWFSEWKGRPVFVAYTVHQALAFVLGRVIEGTPWRAKKGGGDVQGTSA